MAFLQKPSVLHNGRAHGNRLPLRQLAHDLPGLARIDGRFQLARQRRIQLQQDLKAQPPRTRAPEKRVPRVRTGLLHGIRGVGTVDENVGVNEDRPGHADLSWSACGRRPIPSCAAFSRARSPSRPRRCPRGAVSVRRAPPASSTRSGSARRLAPGPIARFLRAARPLRSSWRQNRKTRKSCQTDIHLLAVTSVPEWSPLTNRRPDHDNDNVAGRAVRSAARTRPGKPAGEVASSGRKGHSRVDSASTRALIDARNIRDSNGWRPSSSITRPLAKEQA